jgi:hypothetical protein
VSVFLATYFETNGHFDSNVKLFPVIYANYRPMTDNRRQTETLDMTEYAHFSSHFSQQLLMAEI